MTRQYNPHINQLTGLPECLYAGCGREIPSDHYLCKTHYVRLSDGLVEACPGLGCKRFKSISYDSCFVCSKHLEPESDPAWDAGDEGCGEFDAYLLVSPGRRLVPGPHSQPAQPGLAASGRPVPHHPGRRLPPGVVRGLSHQGRGSRRGGSWSSSAWWSPTPTPSSTWCSPSRTASRWCGRCASLKNPFTNRFPSSVEIKNITRVNFWRRITIESELLEIPICDE